MKIFNFQFPTSKNGFTLIEAVVATAIFAFVVTSILGTYMAVLRLNTRSRALRAVAQDSRFITDFISKEVRNGHIDYTKGTYSDTGTILNIVNQSNESEEIVLTDDNNNVLTDSGVCATSTCHLRLDKIIDGQLTQSNLTSDNVKVTKFLFIISPTSDPFTAAKNVNEQPSVTLILGLTAHNLGSRDEVSLNTQSTYSELYYPSRQ